MGIYYATGGTDGLALTVGGGPATTITATLKASAPPPVGITLRSADGGGGGNLDLIVGSAGAVTIVDGGDNGDGLLLNQPGRFGTATIDVRDTVTIGSSGTRMGQRGIRFINAASSTGNVRVENAAAIYSSLEGIYALSLGTGIVTVSNRGAIDASDHAVFVRTSGAGAMNVSNSGNLKAAGANKRGIDLQALGNGAITLTLTGGRIVSAAAQGVYVESQGTGAIAIRGTDADAETPSGPTITAATHGIHIDKTHADATAGDIDIATTGGSITTGDGDWHGIFVADNDGYDGSVEIDNAAGITAALSGIYVNRAGAGTVSVTHHAGLVLGQTQSGIFAQNAVNDPSDVTVAILGGTVRSTGQSKPAVHAHNRGSGGVTVTVAADATASSRQDAGIFASLGSYDSQLKVTQGGAVLGRAGILAQAPHHATTVTVAPRRAEAQPVIDIVWTGTFTDGNTAHTAANDDDRLAATTVQEALNRAREVAAATATGYGAPAGIEAQVMTWRDVVNNVVTGEGFIPYDSMAQQALFAPSASADVQATRNDIVAQVRAALVESAAIDASALVAIVEAAAAAVLPFPDGVEVNGELSDAEIVAFLSVGDVPTRVLLTGILPSSFSEKERAVLRALATGDGAALDAALDDAEAAFSDGYKTTVRGFLDRYNVGNIRIAMNRGSIASRGDGIRAYYATAHDDNGAIDVTVAEGAEVTGGVAGIRVANAGLGAGEDGMADTADDIRKQTVTVNGMVTGGTHSDPKMRDAAVHLVGGGTLTVGEMGKVVAGAGQPAILVNDPGRSVVTILGTVEGGEGADAAVVLSGGGSVTVGPMGEVNANGATSAFKFSRGTYQVAVYATGARLSKSGVDDAIARVLGGFTTDTGGMVTDRAGDEGKVTYAVFEKIGDYTTGRYLHLELDPMGEPTTVSNRLYAGLPNCPDADQVLDEDGNCVGMPSDDDDDVPPLPTDCNLSGDRCRLYEVLPSTLLAMNGLPTYEERMSAARDARGGWARVEAARGKWKADSWTTQPDVDLAYDHSRSGVRAGMDFAMGDAGRVGVSVHGLRGSAEMAQVGEVDLSGSGLGVHGTTAFADGFYLDAQAAATWYEADLKSTNPAYLENWPHGTLKNDVNGRGYALGVEVGKRLPAMDGGVTVTPRAGLRWSKVVLSDFTDEIGSRVSVKDARSLRGRAGVGAEKALDGLRGWTGARLFGSLDVEQEFKEETEANVMGSPKPLKASAEKTRLRAAAGAVRVWDEGRYALQGSVGYTAGGGDNRDLGGGLSFAIRF